MAKDKDKLQAVRRKQAQLARMVAAAERLAGNPIWVVSTQADVLAFFGVAPDTLRSWRRSGMPGERGKWDLAAIVRWLRTEGPWRIRGSEGIQDPMLAGPSDGSPAMERYRQARAELAEMDRDERRGVLIPRDRIHERWQRAASILRQAVERLEREYGAGAREVIDEALDDVVREATHGYDGNTTTTD